MVRGEDTRAAGMPQFLPPGAVDRQCRAGQRAQRGGAEGDDDGRLDRSNLLLQPNMAGVDLSDSRPFVQPPLPPGFPLEMLHRVGDEHTFPLQAGGGNGPVQHLSRGAHERMAAQILFITGLFAYQHDSC